MKKRNKFLIILSVGTILLSNVPPGRYVFDYVLDEKHYQYSNASESFKVTDRSGNNLAGVKTSFGEFIKKSKSKPIDTILYRNFWKSPLAFWRWHAYLNKDDKRYELPYKK